MFKYAFDFCIIPFSFMNIYYNFICIFDNGFFLFKVLSNWNIDLNAGYFICIISYLMLVHNYLRLLLFELCFK